MRKSLVTYCSLFFLVLAFIGQPLAAARMDCAQLPGALSVSEMSNMDEHHHDGHSSSAGSMAEMSVTMDHTKADADCCQDIGCAASHCFSSPLFMTYIPLLDFSDAAGLVIVLPRDTYLSSVSDSPYRPPILA